MTTRGTTSRTTGNAHHAARPSIAARRALDALEAAARGTANLVPLLLDAVEASVTLGEICGRLRGMWGEYQHN